MSASYGVVWQEDSLPPTAGRLDFTRSSVRLEGRGEHGVRTEEIAYASVTSARIGRARGERLAGRPTLVLERGAAAAIRVAILAPSSVLTEILERVTAAA